MEAGGNDSACEEFFTYLTAERGFERCEGGEGGVMPVGGIRDVVVVQHWNERMLLSLQIRNHEKARGDISLGVDPIRV